MRREPARVLLVAVCLASLAALAVASGGGAVAGATDDAPTTTTTTATTPGPANETPAYGLVALYETDDGAVVRETVIRPDDVAEVGPVERDSRTGAPYVTVTLTEAGAENFTEAMLAAGFGDGGTCRYESAGASDPGECLLTVVDGDVVYSAGTSQDLGRSIRNGEFADDPRFRLVASNESQAEALRAAFAGENGSAPGETTAEPTAATTTTADDGGASVPGFGSAVALAAVVLALASGLARERRRR